MSNVVNNVSSIVQFSKKKCYVSFTMISDDLRYHLRSEQEIALPYLIPLLYII